MTSLPFLPKGWSVSMHDLALPVPPEEGAWLLDAELFSQGNDFTNAFAQKEGYRGNSLLRDLWRGQGQRACEGASALRVWVLHHAGQPQGVVAWLHTQTPDAPLSFAWAEEVPAHSNHHPKARIPIAPLGHVMCFLKKPFRKQGLIKAVMQHEVLPQLLNLANLAREQGHMPLVAANDATHTLLARLTHIPLVEHFQSCQALRHEVWRYHLEARMYPEDPPRQAPYLVPSVPILRRKASVRL